MSTPWWARCRRQIHLDFHTPEFPDDCFAEFDADRAAATFARAGVQAVKVFAKGHFGNSFYPTKVGHKHGRLEGDYLGEMTRALHEKKIRLMAYFSVCFDQRLARSNPEWLQVGLKGRKTGHRSFDYLCLNSPYQEKVLLPAFEEVLGGYEVDGLWLDIVTFASGEVVCLCEWCRDKFGHAYGTQLTPEAAPDLEPQLEEFRLRTVADFICRTRALIDRHRPGAAFTYNHALHFNSLAVADEQVSFGAHEVHNHQNVYSPEIAGAALRTSGKPFECIPTTFHFGWGEWTCKGTEQLKYECSSIIFSGGNINLGDHMPRTGRLEQGVYRKIGEVFRYVRRREKYTTDAETVCYAAVLGLSGDYYWNRPYWSAARMLADGHYQFDILDHKNLARELSSYRVLVFPFQPGFKPPRRRLYLRPLPRLTSEQLALITDWVRGGGVLVLDYDSTLAECAGIRHMGTYGNSVGYIEAGGRFARDWEMPLLVRSPFAKIELAEARGLLEWRMPYAQPTSEDCFSNRNTPPPGERSQTPAVTVRKLGKGKVIYFAPDLFTDYVDHQHPWTRALFLDILDAHAPEKPFEIEAPSTVHARLTRKGKERHVHLLNAHVQPRTIHFSKAHLTQPEIIERIPPVHDIIVRLPGRDVRSATLEPSGTRLRVRKQAKSCEIEVPKLEIYDVVRIV